MFELAREDDFVEYFLFPKIASDNQETKSLETHLNSLLNEVNSVVESICRQYIWHKDSFCLKVRTNDESKILLEQQEETIEKLPPHLYGISYYGENIQDEWFIVYLLYEITKKVPALIARVIDSDGEFLLIEAADVLPKWANPETCEGRVFIYDGKIHVVQNSPSNSTSVLSVCTATSKIWSNSALYKVSAEINNCVEERFKDFRESFDSLFHHQIVRVSIGVAALLKEQPSLIASSVRSFCERDSIDMKACKAMRYFPPENRVRTLVKFTKCLYAMLTHSNYVPDQRIGWELPPSGTEEYKEDLLGIKIASGFEILAYQARGSLSDDELENENNWKTYINNLKRKGYFKENVENSAEYTKLLNEAKSYYRENRDYFNTRPNVGRKIMNLLNCVDANTMEQLKNEENSLGKSDSDDWLNISSEELNAMLVNKYGIKKLYQANGNVNASEFTKNIENFLEKRSGIDGVEEAPNADHVNQEVAKKKSKKKSGNGDAGSSKASDPNQIDFDPDAFSTHIKSFLDFVIPEDNWESNSEMSDYEDEDDLEKNLEDMANDNAKVNLESYFKNYTEQMDKELANTTVGKTFSTLKPDEHHDEDDFDDIESFKPIDINVNTLKSMMNSYKTQIGGSGPVSTLLNAMGVGIEKDDEAEKKPSELSETQV